MSERMDKKLSRLSLGVNASPRVSVVIPVFNAEKTLQGCLSAVVSQEFPKEHYEVIVVDNGSSDGTWSLIQSYGSQVHGLQESKVQSSYAARNAGVRASRGALIAFTDADCVPDARWLSHLVANFENQRAGCVAGEILSYNPVTSVEKFAARTGVLRQRKTLNHPYRPYAVTANVAYRRKVFEQIGLFNSSLKSGGDGDLSWRMQEQTSWEICFNDAAIVLHQDRNRLRDLWRQFVRYGQGSAALQALYADYRQPSLASVLGGLRKLLRLERYAVNYLIATLLMRNPRRISRETVEFAFYDFVIQAAYIFGTLRGSGGKVSKIGETNDVLQEMSCD